ncbi:hypothetical protein [Dyadobacter arcticus]|uniref:Uncharacterized protein n=1 Tax=Dyadobacter arcticus TaxID=1078754 RepID=A0ABX0UQ46_9BACT|nr:hypothetical protein [Dyadobacter arcticus]NIJ54957.1 hypothetical protein [Dyadobacter arcticus]
MELNENNPPDSDGLSEDSISRDGLPPFVSTWKQLYIVMIGTLALLIILFYLFMTHFQ